MSFAHLHVHTEYSLLDGSNKIKEYVSRCKDLGMNSAAITDHGVMYGVIDFYKEALAQGIKPILGCEVYVSSGSRFDKEKGASNRYHHLVLLAKDNAGYSNLTKIVSIGFVEGYYYKPRIDIETLEKYHDGIVALSACLAGEVPRLLAQNNYDEARKAAIRHLEIFGKDNYFLELQDHGIPEQKLVNQQLLRLSADIGVDLVATNDVHYTYESDAEPHDLLLCIQTGKKVTDKERMRYEGGQYFVKSEEEMAALFSYAPQAIENTQKIADRCNVTIEFGKTKLPRFDVPGGYDSWTYLNKLCYEGLNEKYGDINKDIEGRLEMELSVIKDMGFVDYFLIVSDFIRYARENGIMVGPGRGSAAGSVVSYVLGITKLDPIKYNLLFERFLNPERVTMPDIDIDFCYERRQEVIDYVVRKYGKDCVAQIVTFGTLMAKGVVRDVGRVLDFPYSTADQVAKMIPNELNITLERALALNPKLSELYENDPDIHNLIDMAKRLEGLPRHTSMHAAGVVISQKPVVEYVPLSSASDGSVTTQFTMTTIEELGLLKMDFLGLRTLTVIRDAINNVEQSKGKKLDLYAIDYDDPKVLDMIGKGNTEGVFQLESAGMTSFMKELRPHSLEDIIAGISLYRPGPMEFIPKYIRGKNHPETVTYDCPQLEEILRPTYGCIIYQEQVMQIVRSLGGYTLGRSDLVRRAMSKKKAEVMEKERHNFVYGNEAEGVPGCQSNGIPPETANKIFDDMTDFARYAFNKSHAAAYAVVAVQTAFLRYYYPVEYMAALLTSVIDNTDKVGEYIHSCRNMGIKILPPDVNKSQSCFSVQEDGIRFGLCAIKSVGRTAIASIIENREKFGEFRNLENFIERVSEGGANKRLVENLIKAGALDCLEGNRRQKMTIYEQIWDGKVHQRKHSMPGQIKLFDISDDETKRQFEFETPQMDEYPPEVMLAFEKEVSGIYISGHPLHACEELIKGNATAKTSDFQLEGKLADGQAVTVGGIISAKTIKYTRKNQIMAFVTLEDLVGTVEAIIFPKQYELYGDILNEDSKVFIKGRAATEDDGTSRLICEEVISFESLPRELWIQFPDRAAYEGAKTELFDMLSSCDGKDSVSIYIKSPRQLKHLPDNWNIKADSHLLQKLYERFGEDNVKVTRKKI